MILPAVELQNYHLKRCLKWFTCCCSQGLFLRFMSGFGVLAPDKHELAVA